ncbi:hypothetical protein [Burkholderia sp. S-53]|nr:hypothetical protein [Burkholderia sp. S-53]UXU89896.1 hypothetical protein LXM88_31680 [Burkholderia sp. S-53]
MKTDEINMTASASADAGATPEQPTRLVVRMRHGRYATMPLVATTTAGRG